MDDDLIASPDVTAIHDLAAYGRLDDEMTRAPRGAPVWLCDEVAATRATLLGGWLALSATEGVILSHMDGGTKFWVCPDDAQAAAHGAARIVREVLTRRLEDLGGLVWHACALAVGSRGVLRVGPKSAGTSTLALAGMVPGHRLVANDRTFLWRDRAGGPRAVGCPSGDGSHAEPSSRCLGPPPGYLLGPRSSCRRSSR